MIACALDRDRHGNHALARRAVSLIQEFANVEMQGPPSRSPTVPRRKPSPVPEFFNRQLGRYVVLGRLGRGGMGIVYEAEDTLLKRQVAIKMLPTDVSANPEALRRFLREAQSAARLNHPNVVAVYDIGESEGTHYIVMELVTGGSAQDFLQARGRFPWTDATRIMIDVCRGVSVAHKAGMIHRDIKPSNILRSLDGVVKLGDFGLVKPAGRQTTKMTALGAVLGTPHYMSPEQSQSTRLDERSDIYSLGATYFALLTGRPPYSGVDSVQVMFAHCSHPIPDAREVSGDIPTRSTEIIRKAMAKRRDERYADAGSLLLDLETLLKQSAPAASPPSVPPMSAPWSPVDATVATDPLSFADAYRGERTLAKPKTSARRWIGLGLGALLLLATLIASAAMFSRQKEAVIANDDWPGLAAAAENSIRDRRAPEMRRVLKRLQVLQLRLGERIDAAQRDAMGKAVIRLEKAAAFRESTTEKGLVLGTSGHVSSVAFSPNDRWLAAANSTADGGVTVWDSGTGVKTFTLLPRRNNTVVPVGALAFSPDEKTLAAACLDPVGIRLCLLDTGEERSLAVDKSVKRIHSLAFSPISRTLAAGFEPFGDGLGRPYAKLVNVDTGQAVIPFKAEHSRKVTAVTFSAGGQQVVTGSHDKRVIMWNTETGRIWREVRTGFPVSAVSCAPRGGSLAVAGVDDQGNCQLQFWDYAGERLLASRPLPGACRSLAYSPDGELLACGSGPNIVLWNTSNHTISATLSGHGQDVAALAFPARGGILASGSDDQTMRLWDVTRFLPPSPEK